MAFTYSGIRVMRTQMFGDETTGDRGPVPNVAIVITDGVSNRDEHLTVPEADLAREDGK